LVARSIVLLASRASLSPNFTALILKLDFKKAKRESAETYYCKHRHLAEEPLANIFVAVQVSDTTMFNGCCEAGNQKVLTSFDEKGQKLLIV
jgi:hypothetical protein